MSFKNIFKSALPVVFVIGLGLFWSCNVNEPATTTTLDLKLYDSLSKDRGLYDSVRVDIQNEAGTVVFPAIFHGEYLKSRDSAKLANLQLGANPPNPIKVVITGYKGNKEALQVTISIKDKQADSPIATVLTTPVVVPPETTVVVRPETTVVVKPVKILPEKVLLSDTVLTLGVNSNPRRVYATLKPDSAIGGVTFSSDKPLIAEVDAEGNITPLAAGSAVITAQVTGNATITATVKVTVIVPPAITSVTIKKPVGKLYVGAPETPLVLSHLPANLTLIPEFESSDIGIVKVIGNSVKALAEGRATVTVRPSGVTGVSDTVQLQTVKDVPVIDAGIDQSVAVGQAVTFKVKVTQEFGSLALSWDFNADQSPDGSATTDSATATYTYNAIGDYNVVFTAKDGEGNTSTLSRRIRVGKVGPFILITSPKKDTLVRNPKITVAYTSDGVPATQDFNLIEGANPLVVKASNATGSDSAKVTVTLDTKAPVVKISSPTTSVVTNMPEITVIWSVDLVDQLTRTKEILLGKQGPISILREWTDSAGNRGADSVQIVRDTLPPSAPTWVGVDTITNNKRPTWNWKRGIGGNGNFVIQFGINAEATTQDSTYAPAADVSDGTYTLKVRERDLAGNLSSWATRNITVKTAGPGAPTFNDALTTRSPTNVKKPTWAWVSSGTIGGGSGTFRWSVNTPVPVNGEGLATQYTPAADLPDGAYTLSLQERDALGNWSNPAITRAITISTQSALVAISSPTNGAIFTTTSVPVTWTVNSGAPQTNTETLSAGDGTKTITRSYTDPAGNVSSVSVQVVLDGTAPTVSIDGAATRLTNASALTLTGLASDATSGIKSITVSGAATGNGAATYNATAKTWTTSTTTPLTLIEGLNTITITATDNGNLTRTATVSITLDTQAPGQVTFSASPTTPARTTSASTHVWTWGGNGPYEWRLSQTNSTTGTGTAIASKTYSRTGTLADGTWYFQVRESDAAGNWGPWGTSTIVIDNSVPGVPTVRRNAAVTKTASWDWDPSTTNGGNGQYRYRYGTGAYIATGVTSEVYSPNLADGTYNLCVSERDVVDYGAEDCESITVDNDPPDVEITYPSANGFITNAGSIRLRYRVDGGAEITSPTDCNLTNGSATTCSVSATDAANNNGSASRSVWYRRNVVFVRSGVSGGNGSSWDQAYDEIYEAIGSVNSKPANEFWEIWVTAGNRYQGFDLGRSNVSILGGFATSGYPNVNNARNPGNNISRLIGRFRIADPSGGGLASITVDGFHILDLTTGITSSRLSSIRQSAIRNLWIERNTQAGDYGILTIFDSQVDLSGVYIRSNQSDQVAVLWIGGMSTVSIDRSDIASNTSISEIYQTVGIRSDGSSVTIRNSSFSDNMTMGMEWNGAVNNDGIINISNCNVKNGRSTFDPIVNEPNIIWGSNCDPTSDACPVRP